MMLPDIVFRNRLAGRLFGYFLLLAFMPILGFGYLTDWQITQQMEKTHDHYLLKTAEMFNQLFLNRLMQVEAALRLIRDDYASLHPGSLSRPASPQSERRYFSLLTLRPGIGDGFSARELSHLHSGKALLRVFFDGNEKGLAMLLRLPGEERYIEARILPEALWGMAEELPLPRDTVLRVVSPHGDQLFSSGGTSRPLPPDAESEILSHTQGRILVWPEDQPTICYFRELFLEGHYLFPRWTLVLMQAQEQTLASRTGFMGLFPLLVALCLGLVLYAILVLIRRAMTPLMELRDMTRRVSAQDFEARVDIRSGDEVEELGQAFNAMSVQLKHQFLALKTQAAIDREILSAMDVDTVVTGALAYFAETFSSSFTALFLWDKDVFRVFVRRERNGFEVFTAVMTNKELERLWGRIRNAGWLDVAVIPELSSLTLAHQGPGGRVCSVPRHGPPMGFLCLGDVSSVDVAHLDLAGRTLNQIAVAFTNIRLLRELHEYNWGTLEALARAVDEKSSWTQGHSNRVAALAMELAEQMGWTDADLDLLHRAALLHDLGKIGISREILDKPGRLNEVEFSVIRTHPDRGAKILEPVRAYASVIPMVRHHHERYDGSGYPDGLAGAAIPLGARILAVADVYDAVSVTRPYRKAWSHAEACVYLRQNAGILFDPQVVEVFMLLWQPVEKG